MFSIVNIANILRMPEFTFQNSSVADHAGRVAGLCRSHFCILQ